MFKLRIIFVILIGLFLSSCSNDNEARLQELDKVFGKCDNPHRHYSKRDYKICKAKVAAGDPNAEIISLSDMLFNQQKDKGNITFASPVNTHLWNASLKVLEAYPIKNADSNGGYLETEFIYDKNSPQERCTIKIMISSPELLSTSVSSKIICEEKTNDIWAIKNQSLVNDEKKLTIKILAEAELLKNSQAN